MEVYLISLLLITVFGLGLSAFFDKLAVRTLGPKAGFVVYLIVSTIFAIYFFYLNNLAVQPNLNDLKFAVVAGIFAAIGSIAFYTLLQKEHVSLVLPLASIYPAIAVLLGLLILHEKINLVNAAGILLAILAGVLLAV